MTSPTRAARRQLETPVDRMAPQALPAASAMKGVVLTETGEPLATPTPGTKLVDIFVETPKIGNNSLGFAKIFDFDKEDEEETRPPQEDVGTTRTRMSPSKRRPDGAITRTQKETEGSARLRRADSVQRSPSKRKSVGASTNTQSQATAALVPSRTAPAPPARRPSRLRRPSISSRSHAKRVEATATDTPDLDATITTTSAVPPSSSSSSSASSSSSGSTGTVTSDDTIPCAPPATPKYDLHDEDNLPSPFLRRFERERGGVGAGIAMGMEVEVVSRGGASGGGTATITRLKRPSGANLLRVAAAANSAKAAGSVAVGGKGNAATATGTMTRTSVRRAREEARNALLRM
jgi:NIMA (never in mitosis gene a)-related kinase 2